MLTANMMSKAMRLAPAIGSRASLKLFRSPQRPLRAPARAINTAAAQEGRAPDTQRVAVQQQRGNPQQAQQQQQPQQQQQGMARQQAQQQGMPQPTQPQQGMPQQRQQPAGVRLQRVPLSAVLSPLDDFGPGFGRVGGFLRSIEDEMNSMMRAMEYGDNMTGGSTLASSADARQQEPAAPLHVDIHELDNEIVLKADTPGMTGADVKVTFEPEARMLSISGTRASEHSDTDEAGRFSRLERRFGSFQRRFKLPQNVDAGAISAKVNNGELEVRIPKTAAAPKQQEIKVQ
jgi:HSP20 family molecular chaperone IbpA